MAAVIKSLLKWPLLVAAALIVVRVILEQAGAPESVNNIFGVAWLYFVVPFFFAIRIAASGDAHPFKTLFKSLLAFSAISRLMVMPTYWLAYALQWPLPRFGLQMGGVVGEGVSPLSGYVLIPLRNAVLWTVAATVVGTILGSLMLLVRRRRGEVTAS